MANGKKNYFRHSFFARDDIKLRLLRDEVGIGFYFYYFTLLELCGVESADESKVEFEFHDSIIRSLWGVNLKKSERVANRMHAVGLLFFEKGEKTFRFRLDNFPKYMGKYQNKITSNTSKERKEKKRKGKESKVTYPLPLKAVVSNVEIQNLWNDASGRSNLKKCKVLSEKRKKQIAKTILLYPEMSTASDWENYFKKITESAFMCGGGNSGWVADFDWVIKPDNIIKVVEGKYESTGNVSRSEEILKMENPYA